MTPIQRRADLLADLNDTSATLRRQIEAANTDAELDDIAERMARISEFLTSSNQTDNPLIGMGNTAVEASNGTNGSIKAAQTTASEEATK